MICIFPQILQTDKGSPTRNIKCWAKSVWNIFDLLMYLLFFVSVMARCLLNLDDFYYARLAYAITLAMFIFRTMHFFFVTRYLGPKVVMIGRMVSIPLHILREIQMYGKLNVLLKK